MDNQDQRTQQEKREALLRARNWSEKVRDAESSPEAAEGDAAGTAVFLVPILVFTILLRKQLLRGITFGAVRK